MHPERHAVVLMRVVKGAAANAIVDIEKGEELPRTVARFAKAVRAVLGELDKLSPPGP